jgi:hypothetical protein
MQLLGENNEFKEGAAALRETLAQEPALLRTKVEPLLKKGAEESQNLANQAESHDANKLSRAHSAFADSLKGIGCECREPESVRCNDWFCQAGATLPGDFP